MQIENALSLESNQRHCHEQQVWEFLPTWALAQLTENGCTNHAHVAAGEEPIDFFPVVKLITPDGYATWLLSEIDPTNADIAFGLHDPGFGLPALKSVRLSVLSGHRGRLGLPIEHDPHFKPEATLGTYVAQAKAFGRLWF